MKRITSETENKLLAVIDKTVSLVNNGMHPNDAIVKVASESQLRPGEINVVVHAYNTGRTSRQRLTGNDLFEKAAEFELADASKILATVYPDTVKSAAAIQNDTAVSVEYGYSPEELISRRRRSKLASTQIDWRQIDGERVEPPAPLPVDTGYQYRKAAANVSRAKDAAEAARATATAAFDQLGKTFTDLTTYFRRPDAVPLPVVKEAVILLHGDKGEQLIDQLVRVTPALTKLSNHQSGNSLLGANNRSTSQPAVADVDCSALPFPLVSTFMQQLRDYNEKRASYVAAMDNYERQVEGQLRPFVQPCVSTSILGPSSDARDKVANPVGVPNMLDFSDPLKLLGTYSLVSRSTDAITDKVKGPDDTVRVNKMLNQLTDPEHEMRLREINTQAMLQDLMVNDPVISGYDQSEVTDAFNDITQISPSVADQRMLMQSLLRKRLQQGQLDTFEQDQLLGFEDKLRRQFQPVSGGSHGSVI